MRTKVSKENYQIVRRKGQRNLRRLLVLFYLFLICYSILGYFVLDMLFVERETVWFWSYLLKATGMLLCWLIIILLLWRFRRIAKTLFALFALLSMFVILDMIKLLEASFEDRILTMIQYLYCVLMVMKTILILGCMLKMRMDPYMRCIWSFSPVYEADVDEDEKDEDEQDLGQQIPFQMDERQVILRLPANDRLVLTARKRIRINTWLLAFACYGGFLFFYLFLTLLELNNRQDIGLVYIHRAILLSTLFSILAWLLPLTSMFLYLRITKLTFAIAWCAELIRLLYSIPTAVDVFSTQQYSWFSLGMYLTIEVLRYLLYYKLTMRVLRDPFIERYWSKLIRSEEAYE